MNLEIQVTVVNRVECLYLQEFSSTIKMQTRLLNVLRFFVAFSDVNLDIIFTFRISLQSNA